MELQIAYGVFRPKPLVEQLGLQTAYGVFRPKPLVEQLGLQTAYGVFRPKPLTCLQSFTILAVADPYAPRR